MSKVRFGELVKEVKNKIDRSNNPYEYYVAGDHMDSEDLQIHRKGRFATDDVGPAFIREFKKGQILYGSRRTYLKKVAVADFNGVTANTTFVLETKDENRLLQSLIPFIMLSEGFTKWSISKSKGSTNPYILFSDLENYEFNLPPLNEQKKLSDVLWAMDRVKNAYKNLIAKTDELVKSQFVEMFGTEESPKNNTRFIPLGQIASYINGFAFKPEDWGTSGLPIIRIQNLTGTNSDYNYYSGEYPSQVEINDGDVLISWSASLGVYVWNRGKAILNQHIFKVVFDKKPILKNYFIYAVSQKLDALISQTHGSTMKHIVKSKFDKTPIAYPTEALQCEFAAFIEKLDKSKFTLKGNVKF